MLLGFAHLYETQQLFEWNFNSSLKIIWLLIKSGSSLLLHAINTHPRPIYLLPMFQINTLNFTNKTKQNYGKQCTLCTFLVSSHQRIFLFDVWWLGKQLICHNFWLFSAFACTEKCYEVSLSVGWFHSFVFMLIESSGLRLLLSIIYTLVV